MPITAKAPETKFELVPSGNHIARCYSMVEVGTEVVEYQGEKKSQYKVRITWELPNEKKVFSTDKGEQPYSVSKDYTLSMHEKSNLRHDLENWRGKAFTEAEAKAFDISKLLGAPCMLNVIHRQSQAGNPYATISGITAVPKGFITPIQINPSFILSYDEWNDHKFSTLPEWLRKRIEATPEYKQRLAPSFDPLQQSNQEFGEPVHSAKDDKDFLDDALPF